MSVSDGMIPPSLDCELPEPIRPEGDAGIMVTATCSHCDTLFLLVQKLSGEEWLEAHAWWDEIESETVEYHYPFDYEYFERF